MDDALGQVIMRTSREILIDKQCYLVPLIYSHLPISVIPHGSIDRQETTGLS